MSTISEQAMAAGKHTIEFNADNLPQGVYHYKMVLKTQQAETLRTGKLILEK